jgi:arylsulfatase A-like enzyme
MRILLIALLMVVPAAGAFAAEPRPNFVVVFIDDMGWGDFSCFGNTQASTPQVDRLAGEGLRFSQFYVNSPICSPSRCALTTGQYPQRWRITSYLAHRELNERRGVAQWLDPAAPVLARLLHDSGYATGHFGKWHLGGQRDVGEAPLITEYGFDESLTNFEGLGPRLLGLCDAHDGQPPRRHALGSDKLGRGPVIWYDRDRLTEGFVGAAVQFIDKAAAENRPFYVNIWPDDVHSPFFPPADKRGSSSKRDLYHGVLETMDGQLGVLFDHIRSSPALRDNTLILVCSDNGPEPGAGSAGPFKGAKTTLYEGGIRSPLVVWGPGLVEAEKAGSHNESSVFAAFDLVPSLLTIAGVAAPADVKFDGEDVSATLLGKRSESRQAPIFWRRPPDRKSPPPMLRRALPDLAVREGNWKLLCEYDGSQIQLYDGFAPRENGPSHHLRHGRRHGLGPDRLSRSSGAQDAEPRRDGGGRTALRALLRRRPGVLAHAGQRAHGPLATTARACSARLRLAAQEKTIAQALKGARAMSPGTSASGISTASKGPARRSWRRPAQSRRVRLRRMGVGHELLRRRPADEPHGKFEQFQGDSSESRRGGGGEVPRRSTGGGKPMFAVIWYGTPHSPFKRCRMTKEAVQRTRRGLRQSPWRTGGHGPQHRHAAAKLRELGLADNTLLVFCSDNGGLPGIVPETVGGLRGNKGEPSMKAACACPASSSGPRSSSRASRTIPPARWTCFPPWPTSWIFPRTCSSNRWTASASSRC